MGMKTTLELPAPLFRRAKMLAARRGTTLRSLVIEGLEQVTSNGASRTGTPPKLSKEEAAILEIGRHGIPVLRRPRTAKTFKVTCGMVDRLREELEIGRAHV